MSEPTLTGNGDVLSAWALNDSWEERSLLAQRDERGITLYLGWGEPLFIDRADVNTPQKALWWCHNLSTRLAVSRTTIRAFLEVLPAMYFKQP